MSCVAEARQPASDGAPRVIVAGATGFAGALAAHLLWRHPGFELAAVTGRSEQGRRLHDIYPRYRVPLVVQELREELLDGIDAAVVAYPHAAAAPTVARCSSAARAWSTSAPTSACARARPTSAGTARTRARS